MGDKESLDCFDENMALIGAYPRDVVHAQGYWHQTFHCWVVRREGAARYVVFQQRGATKDLFPNQLDATAAGHLTAGETPENGVREIDEELGLPCTREDLVPLGLKVEVCRYGNAINREFIHVFLVEKNLPLESYQLQQSEVRGVLQVEIQEGLRFLARETDTMTVDGVVVDAAGQPSPVRMTIRSADVPVTRYGYYTSVLIMAERYFQGQKYLSI